MKQITWGDITVQQYIDVYKLSHETEIEPETKAEKVICILFDMTEREVEELPMSFYNEYARQCTELLKEKIPGKAVRTLKIGKKRYAIQYNPAKLLFRQYAEIQFFQGDGTTKEIVSNLHLLTASIVSPMRLWFRTKNKAEHHTKYANDILNAKIVDVYHACLFFCNLLLNLILRMQDSLGKEMMIAGAKTEQTVALLSNLIDVMAGSIPPEKLQLLKV